MALELLRDILPLDTTVYQFSENSRQDTCQVSDILMAAIEKYIAVGDVVVVRGSQSKYHPNWD